MKNVKKIVDINAHITNVACEISSTDGITKAAISFDNLGYGVITAVKFEARKSKQANCN